MTSIKLTRSAARLITLRRALSAVFFSGLSLTLAVFISWTFVTGGANPFVKAVPTPIPVPAKRPAIQGGMIAPRWGADAYGPSDSGFKTALHEISKQTGAKWVEMTIELYQQDVTSTHVYHGESTTTADNLAYGIRTAHEAGFSVYIVPQLTLESTDWAGTIQFGNHDQAAAWFSSYERVLTPYLQAAAKEHAEQFSLGNEYDNIDKFWSDLWNRLVDDVHTLFPGSLTYNFNFNSRFSLPYPWMSNPHLTYLGVSEYESLAPKPQRMTVGEMEGVWQTTVLPELDRISRQLGKQLIVSEIGYRNATDALYLPYVHSTTAQADPDLQAAAYEAALIEIYADPHFNGIYFWAWSLPPFEPNWQPASRVLHAWYSDDQQAPPCSSLLPLLQC